MPKFSRCLLAPLCAASLAAAGENVLVIGDSLSKEYETEFKALYPGRPEAWKARNWCEILDARRNAKFDMGSWGVFADFRLTGHTFNCAKPGGTAREFRNFLRQDSAAEQEIKASSGGSLAWAMFPYWLDTFDDLIGDAEKIVIFYGGNDLALGNTDPEANPAYGSGTKQIDYESIYAGTFGEASNPDRLRNSIRRNIRSIVQYFRATSDSRPQPRYTGPIVLVNAPHVGATPKVQGDTGSNAEGHARCTAMIKLLNTELRALAIEFDLGYADVYSITERIRLPGAFTIGGITFHKNPDPDCGPRALFSGDGFHPNTPAQAKIAQAILDAFREKYPATAGNAARLADREIVTGLLGLEPDLGFKEWLTAHDTPDNRRGPLSDPDADGAPNVLEFALAGRSPTSSTAEPALLSGPALAAIDGQTYLTASYTPRFAENAYCAIIPQQSGDLKTWTDLPASQTAAHSDGSITLRVPWSAETPRYLRLAVQVTP